MTRTKRTNCEVKDDLEKLRQCIVHCVNNCKKPTVHSEGTEHGEKYVRAETTQSHIQKRCLNWN